MIPFDCIVVGAGIAGCVSAERLASQGRKVLIIEERSHIGGNCYDYYNDHGILVHPYGPHIFHTDNEEVWNYLSRFTDWHYYQHRVRGVVDGQLVPIPFNLNTLHALFPRTLSVRLEEKLVETFGIGAKVPILKLRQTDDSDLQMLANYVYEKVFLNYTLKQWGMRPEEISSKVSGRVPVFVSRDDRYFQDQYQALPKHGYTRMFEHILEHPNIHVMLQTSMHDLIAIDIQKKNILFMGQPFSGTFVYTGMIDELFNYQFGDLPYRAIRFEHSTFPYQKYQDAAVINYPNNYTFTRISEFKQITGQNHALTSILREYPCSFDRQKFKQSVPCYPILQKTFEQRAQQYIKICEYFPNMIAIGRLSEYKYYDMDDMVARVLSIFKKVKYDR
jgi:UDP-galactopyranose mutase